MQNSIYKFSGVVLVVALAGLYYSGARIEWTAQRAKDKVMSAITTESQSAPVGHEALADIRALSRAFTSLSETVSPAVVNIYTKSGPPKPDPSQELERYFGFLPFDMPQMKREALGSGFVIQADEGYVVTNAHVVRMAGHNAEEIMIKLIGEEAGKGHSAKVIGADEISDVALLKLNDKIPGLKAIPLGDSSKTKVAEWVLAIGNPYGHTNTITQGIVSAMGRTLEGARSEFLQTSAGINPGNSGGPLINMDGEVIGINSAMDPRAQNIGFAIPINTAKTVIAQLMEGGRVRRAWLGIGIEDITDEAAGLMRLKDKDGVLVKQVVSGAPAAKAGIEAYDVIRKINGEDVHSTRDLFRTLDRLSAGKSADLEIWRDGRRTDLKVHLGEQPTNS